VLYGLWNVVDVNLVENVLQVIINLWNVGVD